jgi:hypothetical protein
VQASYADLALYNAVNALLSVGGGAAVLATFPLVQQHHRSMSNRPRLQAYAARDVYKKSAL